MLLFAMVLKRIQAESTLAAAVKAIGAYLTGSGLRPGDRGRSAPVHEAEADPGVIPLRGMKD